MGPSFAENETTTRIAVVGAATPSGESVRAALERHRVPGSRVDLYAVTRGEVMVGQYAGEARLIQDPDPEEVSRHGLVFICQRGDDTERLLGGCDDDALIVDVAGALRSSKPVLVHMDITGKGAPSVGRVATPHPIAVALTDLLHPVQASLGLVEASAVALRPAADFGEAGVEELRAQVVGLLNFAECPREVFRDQLAFNVIPQERVAGDEPGLESRIAAEVGALVGPVDRGVAVRALTVPVFHGLGLSVRVVPRSATTRAELVRSITAGGLVEVPPNEELATPAQLVGERRSVLAGAADDGGGGFWLWALVGAPGAAAAEHGVRLARATGRL